MIPSQFKAHPWHGISPGEHIPDVVTCYVEIVPTDTVKYEVDKESGHLKVDRPQKYSSQCPTLYGFIPRTYCGPNVGKFCSKQTGRSGIVGDGDPIDICILTERSILNGNVLVQAVPIGGLRMIDREQADDKIIAVLKGDAMYGGWQDITNCPSRVLDRLQHYFLTYKDIPGQEKRKVEIVEVYGAQESREVIMLSCEDYRQLF